MVLQRHLPVAAESRRGGLEKPCSVSEHFAEKINRRHQQGSNRRRASEGSDSLAASKPLSAACRALPHAMRTYAALIWSSVASRLMPRIL